MDNSNTSASSSAITKVEVLKGHTTPETAYVVDDYPYGFRLRCKIRYWLEYKRSQGFRLVSQTTDPKRSYEHWNKPKASGYATLAVMGRDEKGHVTWSGLSIYRLEYLPAWMDVYGDQLDEIQMKVAIALGKLKERQDAKQAAQQTPATPATPATPDGEVKA